MLSYVLPQQQNNGGLSQAHCLTFNLLEVVG
jgi:hypothetical protein